MFEKQITYRFIDALRHIEYGSITVNTPDGRTHYFEGRQPGTICTLALNDWRAIVAFARHGDTGFAEAYRDGWWDSADVADLLHFGLHNEAALDAYIYGGLIGQVASRIAYLFTRNTVKGSRKNIHAHYDLGNDFYALWLDPTMTYSSALFKDKNDDLSTAQNNKYDRIIERMGQSGNVLEIGCGWGGFAERSLSQKDYAVKGLTISPAQHEYATRRLNGKANIALEDYRNQSGKYDYIVSIEMFEAVGEQFWSTYFEKVKSLLAGKGKAIIQTITIRDNYFERYRKYGDAIRSLIFPGGMLPSLGRFNEETKKAGLRVTDQFDFGQDYALTLRRWLSTFESKLSEVRAMGFDEPFIRIWRYYLNCCIASFSIGRTNVTQMELQHAA